MLLYQYRILVNVLSIPPKIIYTVYFSGY